MGNDSNFRVRAPSIGAGLVRSQVVAQPIHDDPEVNCPRRFPCAEFPIRRNRIKGSVVDIECRGEVLAPEMTAPPYSDEEFRRGLIPGDGEIIRDRTYDQLKLYRTANGRLANRG